jgi:hypothetical protein
MSYQILISDDSQLRFESWLLRPKAFVPTRDQGWAAGPQPALGPLYIPNEQGVVPLVYPPPS